MKNNNVIISVVIPTLNTRPQFLKEALNSIEKQSYLPSEVIIVNNEIELSKYFKKNLTCNEIIIGMGAGAISKWMAGLKNTL